jgi:uncharacterized membrane protein
MDTGQAIILVVYLLGACLLVGLAIPLAMRWVPPNRVYGFRTRATLEDPNVWYPVNRVTGIWLIATGIATAAVSTSTFLAGLGLRAEPMVNLLPIVGGCVGILIHGLLLIRRLSGGPRSVE